MKKYQIIYADQVKGGDMKTEQDMVTMDRITLEKIRFGLHEIISPALLDEMRFETIRDLTTDNIISRLTTYLFANKVNYEEVESGVRIYPATMWEELKRDFWPRWLRKRFPVRYSRDVELHTHTHYHVCPHLNCKDNRKHLDFMMLNDVGATKLNRI